MEPHKITTREIANTITHGLGLFLFLVGVPILFWKSLSFGSWLAPASVALFGGSLWMMYLSSTVYHLLTKPSWKLVWRKLDHISIYFLIAGSYTPFVFLFLKLNVALTVMVILWSLVAIGTLFKLFHKQRFSNLTVAIYLAMGWMAVFFVKPLLQTMPLNVLLLIAGGGLAYTAGVFFYLRDHKGYNHAIWHVFVLAGSLAHFAAVWMALH